MGILDDVRIYRKALTREEIVSTMGLSELYFPVGSSKTMYDVEAQASPAEIYEEEARGSRLVNFKDYALLMQWWLLDGSWP